MEPCAHAVLYKLLGAQAALTQHPKPFFPGSLGGGGAAAGTRGRGAGHLARAGVAPAEAACWRKDSRRGESAGCSIGATPVLPVAAAASHSPIALLSMCSRQSPSTAMHTCQVEELMARLEEAEGALGRADGEMAALAARAEGAERAAKDAAALKQRELADITNLRWGQMGEGVCAVICKALFECYEAYTHEPF